MARQRHGTAHPLALESRALAALLNNTLALVSVLDVLQPWTPQDLTFLRTSVIKRPYALYSGTKRAHVRHWHHSRPAHTDRRPFFPTRASRSAPTRSRPPLPTAGSTRSRSEGANNKAYEAPTTHRAAAHARGWWTAASSSVSAAPIEEWSSSK